MPSMNTQYSHDSQATSFQLPKAMPPSQYEENL